MSERVDLTHHISDHIPRVDLNMSERVDLTHHTSDHIPRVDPNMSERVDLTHHIPYGRKVSQGKTFTNRSILRQKVSHFKRL